MEPSDLTAAAASAAIARGDLTSEALVLSCLDRIADRDPVVKAWSFVDRAQALAQAREADKRIATAGGPRTPLEGLPIGVKDVIDTADMPTTSNSAIYEGFRPALDAECVRIARAGGAVILGKTDTVEFAAGGRKAATRHPQDPARTPGGSSSGSAAAVADRQVPLAFGTQTAGSLIRPGGYCGIYSLKPTFGAVAWPGAKQFAPSLDTIGWYGRTVADLALMAQAYRLPGLDEAPAAETGSLRIGICRTPYAEECEPAALAALEAAADRVRAAGAATVDLALPPGAETLKAAHETIMLAEGRVHFLGEYLDNGPRLHRDFRDRVENARGITSADIVAAQDHAARMRCAVEALFAEVDAILAPAAKGEAPVGADAPGAWVMNAFWTLLHLPCLGVPAGDGPAGMPLGVQLVAPRFADARLLAAGAALAPAIDPALEG
jgi:Asp-tRNA(Asn)/Glu-tRNA(Gln) amidotransferase A subunit family amidase